jgi:hypothetical protein
MHDALQQKNKRAVKNPDKRPGKEQTKFESGAANLPRGASAPIGGADPLQQGSRCSHESEGAFRKPRGCNLELNCKRRFDGRARQKIKARSFPNDRALSPCERLSRCRRADQRE